MAKFLLSFFCCLFPAYCSIAQQVKPTVLNSAGRFLATEGLFLEFSVGEVAIQTLNGAGNFLTQGFLQPTNLKVLEEVTLFIPNVITPNGDGVNDFFHITNLEFFAESSLIIYNRWGERVYMSTNYRNEWNGGGLSAGVYYYRLVTKNFGEFKGWIQILR